jgi:multiple sugar transport system ATP-binding protein
MAEITFDDVSKVFPDGTVAVDRLDLEVADGEFLVLVGPSGSGKSTALRMVAGLEDISAGDIRIGGQVVNHLQPRDRQIAMVFQNYALYPHMDVGGNIGFALKLRHVPKRSIRERVSETASLLGIGELVHRRPRELSGGQRQRVAMGRAIVREPRAFLMDEPLSNLDAKLRVEMRTYISKLHQRLTTTTVYVTHDQTEAMTMGDRVAVMRDGRIEQADDPRRLYAEPDNTFVASFIGSPAMNLVRGRLVNGDGAVHVELGPQRLPLPSSVLEQRPSLHRYVGREVIVGVRPEDIEDAAYAPTAPPDCHLPVGVALAEPMGAETIAHLDVNGERRDVLDAAALVARLNPRTSAESGSRMSVAIDVERLHFFDPDTEAALR